MNVAVDLDGTLALAGEPDPAFAFGVGPWIAGGRDALLEMLRAGDNVLVHTCRATWEPGGGLPAVEAFLHSGGFVPVLVREVPWWDELALRTNAPRTDRLGVWIGLGKPIADVYLDDRGMRFRSWPVATRELEAARARLELERRPVARMEPVSRAALERAGLMEPMEPDERETVRENLEDGS